MTDLTLNISKIVHAPIEKAFDAWLDPNMLSQFMMPMPGMPESDVENDVREGGAFTIIMHAGEDQLPHTGKYIEINRPDKLVFTWESHCSVDNSIVTLIFTKINENRTNIDLTHVKFINEQVRSDHEGCWSNILDQLNDVIS
ncbi:MAG: SRPBCC domain-containing protein [Methylophaga sp.]|nr:SRPBCC domain-containing protein [Methylophaga sp.]